MQYVDFCENAYPKANNNQTKVNEKGKKNVKKMEELVAKLGFDPRPSGL